MSRLFPDKRALNGAGHPVPSINKVKRIVELYPHSPIHLHDVVL
jgi:hypothetical protein